MNLEERVKELEQENSYMLDLIVDLVSQSCSTSDEDADLCSMAISAYEDAIMFLAKKGLVNVKKKVGRLVLADWREK